MRYSKQQKRRKEIEQVTLNLMIEKGYHSTSMLSVSTRAECSNETMYRWYGKKTELLTDVIKRFRSQLVKTLVLSATRGGGDCALTTMGAVLLEKATSLEGVALLRASLVEQDTHGLGGATTQHKEPIVNDVIKSLFRKQAQLLIDRDSIDKIQAKEAVDTFLLLLIGDLPMRCAFGEEILLSESECVARAQQAMVNTRRLISKH